MIDHDLDCGMVKTDGICERESTIPEIKRDRCCENLSLSLQVDDEYETISPILFDSWDIVLNIDFNESPLFSFISNFKYSFYSGPSPPLIKQNFQILFQSFLL